MKSLHHSCQGESHKLAGKVCQDCSFSATAGGVSVAVVSDGHGGARYFRSDVGAQMAVEAARDCVTAFVKGADRNVFEGKPFTQGQSLVSESHSRAVGNDTAADKALRRLFASVVSGWKAKIEEHARQVPLSEKEKATVDVKYQDAFVQGREVGKTYGCTLMCCVFAESFWFAFHVGDGKIIAFGESGNWSEPVPWDERCFLNKTTSLCDSRATDEFRYCYCGDGTFPLAVFLGSDGIDDSFGRTENMVNFYVQVLKLIAREGSESAALGIEEALPQLSKIGSKDDVSVACIYNNHALGQSVGSLVGWQKKNVESEISNVNSRILALREKLRSFAGKELDSWKDLVDLQYARKELPKAFERKLVLAAKWNGFAKELSADAFVPYADEIGFGGQENDAEPDACAATRQKTGNTETETQQKIYEKANQGE